jgi:hypothetical protein
MDWFLDQELSAALQEVDVSFEWDEVTHTWQLVRCGDNGHIWRSVMYRAENLEDAEKSAIRHINDYYR